MKFMLENVYLEILNGPQKGLKIPLKKGLVLGRTQGDILLADPKISGLHAQVQVHAKGVYILQDRQSQHKIFFEGKKVEKLALVPGLQFRLGHTEFQVGQDLTPMDLQSHLATPVELAPWQMNLKEALQQVQDQEAQPLSLSPSFTILKPTLSLTVIQGLDLGQQWAIGFAPRRVGSESYDIELHEPSCPPIAFEIIQQSEPSQTCVRTAYPALVRFNQAARYELQVHDGLVIEIGKTLLKLEVLND